MFLLYDERPKIENNEIFHIYLNICENYYLLTFVLAFNSSFLTLLRTIFHYFLFLEYVRKYFHS